VSRSVVLVDDAADVRMLLQLLLELEGFTVTATADGPAGLAAVRAEQPDVVLLDVQLPGMDGTEVLRRLRADPPTARLPVVLLTGAPDQDTPALVALGATGVLRKPFDPDTVGAQLVALLARA
jgi:two-component system alkaline phosphatase synthesis response regulator PhoP